MTHTRATSLHFVSAMTEIEHVSEHGGDSWTMSPHLWYDTRALEDELCLLML